MVITVLILVALVCAGTASAALRFPRAGRCGLGTGTSCPDILATTSASGSESEEIEEEDEEEAESGEAATAPKTEEATEGSEDPTSTSPRQTRAATISHLRLTPSAVTALHHPLPPASTIGFSFTLSAPAKVHVKLAMQTGVGRHTVWATLPDSLTMSAARGRLAQSLKAHNRLSGGRYRLTVKPANGSARSIYMTVRR